MKTKLIGYQYLLKLMVFMFALSACNKKEEAEKQKKAPPLNIQEVMNFDKGGDGTYFRSISFADEMHGVVVGIGSSYAGITMSFRTTDGGNTWQKIDLPAEVLPTGNFGFGQYEVHF